MTTDLNPLAITFQEEADPDFKSPWPVTFTNDGTVLHGRPDAAHIVGFASTKAPYDIKVLAINVTEATIHAQAISGLIPVFIGHDGEMFGVGLAINEAHIFTGDQTKLAAKGQEGVETWKRTNKPASITDTEAHAKNLHDAEKKKREAQA